MKESQPTPVPQPQENHHASPLVEETHLDAFYQSPSFRDGAISLAEGSPISAKDLIEMCEGNERLLIVYDDLVKQATRYVETILELDYEAKNKVNYDPETVAAKDRQRRLAHNAFIDSTNRMSRELYRAGEDNSAFAKVINKLPDGTYSRPPYTLFAMQFAMSYYTMKHPDLTN